MCELSHSLFLRAQLLGIILWIVCWTDLFASFSEMNQGIFKPPIYFVTPLILGMTMVIIKTWKHLKV